MRFYNAISVFVGGQAWSLSEIECLILRKNQDCKTTLVTVSGSAVRRMRTLNIHLWKKRFHNPSDVAGSLFLDNGLPVTNGTSQEMENG